MAKTILIFFGPPGSGKGTQADLLGQRSGWQQLSTGAFFRQEIKRGSRLGKLTDKYLKSGGLVPDVIIKKIIEKYLNQQRKSKVIILDGYPRNRQQQNDLVKILKKIFKSISRIYAIEISLSGSEAKKRLSSRRSCRCGAVFNQITNPPKKSAKCDLCGGKLFTRNDDKPRVVAARLKLYRSEIKPVIDYWRRAGRLIKINGEQSINKIHQDLIAALTKLKLL